MSAARGSVTACLYLFVIFGLKCGLDRFQFTSVKSSEYQLYNGAGSSSGSRISARISSSVLLRFMSCCPRVLRM